MKKRLVLAGGGHAHLLTLQNIGSITSKGHEAVLISPDEHHYYSGMGPGMLGGIYEPDQIRFNIKEMAEKGGGIFIRDQVRKIDPLERLIFLGSGETISYDAVSFNTGSMVQLKTEEPEKSLVFPVKPVENLYYARNKIRELSLKRKISVAIIGGGPAASEIAASIHSLCGKEGRIIPLIDLYCERFMPGFPHFFSSMVRKNLISKGIRINEGFTASKIKAGRIMAYDGRTRRPDVMFVATGVTPSKVFGESGIMTGPEGGMSVNRYLQAQDWPEIFGAGDCIHFKDRPLDKAGVYAVRQAPVLFRNICAFLEGKSLTSFEHGGEYMMILNMGLGLGILKKRGIVFSGKSAFMLKDQIDRRFMSRFTK